MITVSNNFFLCNSWTVIFELLRHVLKNVLFFGIMSKQALI